MESQIPQHARTEHSNKLQRSGGDVNPLSIIIVRWLFVCGFSALPSFIAGASSIGQSQLFAMLCGILVFVAGYSIVDYRTQHLRWRQDEIVGRTMAIGYTLRILATLIYPVGFFMDLMCGQFSISIASAFFQELNEPYSMMESASFMAVLCVTLIQGIVLNLILFLLMLFIYWPQIWFRDFIK